MGTSNWQNISFCVELLRRIRPKKVLDVGVGFGRWGMLCREFLDVWDGRVFPEEWEIEIVGIEAYKKNIQPYQKHIYSRIIKSEASAYLSRTSEQYDLIILGDVLEHFEKEEGKKVLEICLSRSQYVLAMIPLGKNWQQDSVYGNSYEQHKSVWTMKEVQQYPWIIKKEFKDYIFRPFGVFVFSSLHHAIPGRDPMKITKKILFNRFPASKRILKRIFLRR
jgi:hypothetical protein